MVKQRSESTPLDWLVICPLAIERQAVQRGFPDEIRWRKHSPRFWQAETSLWQNEMRQPLRLGLLQSGPGQERARAEVSRILRACPARRILLAGLCGGLVSDLPVGSRVCVSSVLDERGSPLAELSISHSTSFSPRVLLSVAEAILSADEKHKLAASTGASVVDMESAGVLRAAGQSDVPISCLRVVSDDVSISLPAEVVGLIRSDGELNLLRALGLVLKPPLFPVLRELQRASHSALSALTAAIREIDWDRPAD